MVRFCCFWYPGRGVSCVAGAYRVTNGSVSLRSQYELSKRSARLRPLMQYPTHNVRIRVPTDADDTFVIIRKSKFEENGEFSTSESTCHARYLPMTHVSGGDCPITSGHFRSTRDPGPCSLLTFSLIGRAPESNALFARHCVNGRLLQ